MMAAPIAIGAVDALVSNTNKSRLRRFVPMAIGTGSGYAFQVKSLNPKVLGLFCFTTHYAIMTSGAKTLYSNN